jgi:uncharacterized protein DUF4232
LSAGLPNLMAGLAVYRGVSRIRAWPLVAVSLVAVCAGCGGPAQSATAQQPSSPAARAAASAAGAASPAAAPSGGGRQAYGTSCRPGQLRLTLGPQVSEATEQDTAVLVLTNVSAAGCDLRGYPGLALSGHHGVPLPFRYHRGGDQMLTGAAPALVPLPPGAAAYFAISKVTCVAHERDVARRIQVTPPGGHRALSHPVRRFPTLGYCPAGDPGHIIDLTPIEPSLRDLASRH